MGYKHFAPPNFRIKSYKKSLTIESNTKIYGEKYLLLQKILQKHIQSIKTIHSMWRVLIDLLWISFNKQ